MAGEVPKIDYVTRKPKERTVFAIEESDWNRVRRMVQSIPSRTRWFEIFASILVGAGVSAGFSLILSLNADVELWQVVLYTSMTIMFMLMGGVLFLVDATMGRVHQQSVDSVMIEVDEIQAKFQSDGGDDRYVSVYSLASVLNVRELLDLENRAEALHITQWICTDPYERELRYGGYFSVLQTVLRDAKVENEREFVKMFDRAKFRIADTLSIFRNSVVKHGGIFAAVAEDIIVVLMIRECAESLGRDYRLDGVYVAPISEALHDLVS